MKNAWRARDDRNHVEMKRNEKMMRLNSLEILIIIIAVVTLWRVLSPFVVCCNVCESEWMNEGGASNVWRWTIINHADALPTTRSSAVGKTSHGILFSRSARSLCASSLERPKSRKSRKEKEQFPTYGRYIYKILRILKPLNLLLLKIWKTEKAEKAESRKSFWAKLENFSICVLTFRILVHNSV